MRGLNVVAVFIDMKKITYNFFKALKYKHLN